MHFANCDRSAACVCETRGYWYLFILIIITAILEFVVARFFAHSGAGQADALHAFLHGLWFALAIYVAYRVRIGNFSDGEEHSFRARFGFVNAILLLFVLCVLCSEAIAKIMHPEPVLSIFMCISGGIGLSGNLIALHILGKIERDHETYHWLSLDTVADCWLSAAVIVGGVFVTYLPLLDPILTFVAICWIGKMGYSLFTGHTLKYL
ncbi:MAG: cation transporter [Parcubacteria group bacterium]|nr:cation transporter [Parcubacteria group bacterium]